MYQYFLEKIDLFGFPINLTYRTMMSYKTSIGGFLTVCMIALYFIAFYFFGKEIIIRRNPITIYNQEFEDHPAVYQISSQTFPFVFGLQDGNTFVQYIDETIYTVTVKNYVREKVYNQVTGNYELVETYYNITIGKCNVEEDVSDIPETIEYFRRLDISQMYCIKKNQNHIPEIEGSWDSHTYKTLVLSFSPCKNSTNYNSCKSQEEINGKLKAGFFSMNYVDLTVNPRDPIKAYKYYGKDSYTLISNLYSKNIDFFLKRVELSSDEGWMFEQIKSQQGVMFSEMKDMLDLRQQEVFCLINIKFQSKKDVYSRQYKKIQNVMAEVEGFLKTFFFICFLITIPFTKLSFYIKLLNQLFLVFGNQSHIDMKAQQEQKEDILEKSNQLFSQQQLEAKNNNNLANSNKDRRHSALAYTIKLTSSQQKCKSYQHQSQVMQIIDCVNDKVSIEKLDDKDFDIKTGGLLMSFYEKISYLLCPQRCQSQKMLKIEKTINNIKEHLDIVFILNKLQELDKLKILLFTPNQLSLFDLLSKPLINIDDQFEDQSKTFFAQYSYQKSHFEKLKDAFLAYQQIEYNQAENFDKKLIDLLDENVKLIFEKAIEKNKPTSALRSLPELMDQYANNFQKKDDICTSDRQINRNESQEMPSIPNEKIEKIKIEKFVKDDNVIR